jgi:hypothetical protein
VILRSTLPRLAAALMGVMVLVAVGCGRYRSVAPGDDEVKWWGKTFTSTAVLESGHLTPLESGTEIDLVFERRDGDRTMRWNAGCDTWGASVTIGADRLEVGDGSSSANGCSEALYRQDTRLEHFFSSEPAWSRDGTVLRLTAGETVIEFRETTDEQIVPASAFTGTWYGPDGDPAERGKGPDRTFEVTAYVGPRHCDWESVVFLSVAWPLGTAYEMDSDVLATHQYVRDPEGRLSGSEWLPDNLDLDAVLPEGAHNTGYNTDQVELWFGSDDGDQYAYLDTDKGVERWPRSRDQIGCA